ncbi:MAG: hypothetical protein SCALA701_29280 [Candidatus Scalindua sp.]|nr:MAG: hypothetical protein SCALA701_29280 [Candidatus Scalindua sp.]
MFSTKKIEARTRGQAGIVWCVTIKHLEAARVIPQDLIFGKPDNLFASRIENDYLPIFVENKYTINEILKRNLLEVSPTIGNTSHKEKIKK